MGGNVLLMYYFSPLVLCSQGRRAEGAADYSVRQTDNLIWRQFPNQDQMRANFN